MMMVTMAMVVAVIVDDNLRVIIDSTAIKLE